MGTLNVFYIRGSNEAVAAAARREFPEGTVETGDDFVGVTLKPDAFEPPEKILAALSAEFGTDLIWLSFQSTVDAFQYYRWHAGEVKRVLVYGCFAEERTWERAEGTPEPWERAAFFTPRGLESALKHLATTPAEKAEFERIWREQEILSGRTEPSMDSRSAAWVVAQHYHFPGWG